MQAREEEKFQAHAVSGMPGSGQLPFLGLQDSPGSSAPLNMGSSLFVAKATGAAHDGRCSRRKCPAPPVWFPKSEAPGMEGGVSVGNARLPLMCSPKAKRQEWAQMRQQPRQAPRRLFFVDPKEKTNGMTAYRRIDPWRQ